MRKHSLKDIKLRRVRYELRTLFHLFYLKRQQEIRNKVIQLNYDEEILVGLRREREALKNSYYDSPISCWFCGDRSEDLRQDSKEDFWLCANHWEEP